MKKLKEFIASPVGAACLFFLAGAVGHRLDRSLLAVAMQVTSYGRLTPLEALFSVATTGMWRYIILLLLSLGQRRIAVVVGGGAGAFIGDIASNFINSMVFGQQTPSASAATLVFILPILSVALILLGMAAGYAQDKNLNPRRTEAPVPERAPLAEGAWRTFIFVGLAIAALPAPKVGPAIVAWNTAPVLLWAMATRTILSPVTIIVSGAALALYNLYMTLTFYFMPIGSYTGSAIGAGLFPAQSALAVLPLALLAGCILNKFLARFLNFRPDDPAALKRLTPWLLVAAVALLSSYKFLIKLVDIEARIGEPRIVAGGEYFRKTALPEHGWLFTGDYDNDGNNELISLDSRNIRLLNPHDFSLKKEWPVPKTLDRTIGFDTFPVQLKPGGEPLLFSKSDGTLYDLEGMALWSFKPGKSSIYAAASADLDGDGAPEFYIASAEGLFRLDADGKTVWSDTAYSTALFPVPAAKNEPAMILSAGWSESAPGVSEYSLRDPSGKLLRKFSFAKADFLPSLIKWGDQYCLVAGKTSHDGPEFYIFDLYGKELFAGKVSKNLGYKKAFAVRFDHQEKPYLAVQAGVGGNVHRQELDVFTMDGVLLYKEILGSFSSFLSVTDTPFEQDYIVFGNIKYEKN